MRGSVALTWHQSSQVCFDWSSLSHKWNISVLIAVVSPLMRMSPSMQQKRGSTECALSMKIMCIICCGLCSHQISTELNTRRTQLSTTIIKTPTEGIGLGKMADPSSSASQAHKTVYLLPSWKSAVVNLSFTSTIKVNEVSWEMMTPILGPVICQRHPLFACRCCQVTWKRFLLPFWGKDSGLKGKKTDNISTTPEWWG